MLLIISHPPAAETAVKAARFVRVHRSEAQSLDGRRSEGYFGLRHLISFALLWFPHSNFRLPSSNPYSNPRETIFLLAACFLIVPAQQPKVALQLPFRGDVSPLLPMRSMAPFQGSQR